MAIHGPALGATAAAAAAASGQTFSIAPSVQVQIAGDDDEALEKAKKELELKEKRAQNMLPSWIAQSTIEKQPPNSSSTTVPDPNVAKVEGDGEGDDGEREQGIVGQVDQLVGEGSGIGEQGEANGGLGAVDIGGFGAAMSFYEQPEDEDEKPDPNENGEGGEGDLDAYYASLEAQNLDQQQIDTPIENGGDSSNYDSPIVGFGIDSPGMNASGTSGTPDGTRGGFLDEDEIEKAIVSGQGGKRSREDSTEGQPEFADKRFKSAQASPTPVETPTVAGEGTGGNGEGDEDEEGDFDVVEGDGDGEENMDPDQLISVNGKMLPYSQVTEDMTSEMVSLAPLCRYASVSARRKLADRDRTFKSQTADEYSVRIGHFFPLLRVR